MSRQLISSGGRTAIMGRENACEAALLVNHLDPTVLQSIQATAEGVEHGSLALIVQDARLIQMDVVNKIRFGSQPVKQKPVRGKTVQTVLQGKIAAALCDMQYGQVMLIIKGGEIVQVERTEKQRFASLQGLYGEGI